MTTCSQGICLQALPQRRFSTRFSSLPTYARWRLRAAMEAAIKIPFDDSSRLVFFSDLHRGDGSRADCFAANAELFTCALDHYYRQGYTYIEVGDGDELWKSWSGRDIEQAHGPVLDLMHRFHREGRQHLIVGNHDLTGNFESDLWKAGMPVHESLNLRHSKAGQQVLVLHGHQADLKSDCLATMGRFLVRSVWKRLQAAGLAALTLPASDVHSLKRIERAISAWARELGQIVICGHTHRPMSAAYGSAPYFNAGSCVFPGYITGLEMRGGEISLVRWSAKRDAHNGQVTRIERQLAAAPRRLSSLGC